jgi:hypothetical protein
MDNYQTLADLVLDCFSNRSNFDRQRSYLDRRTSARFESAMPTNALIDLPAQLLFIGATSS